MTDETETRKPSELDGVIAALQNAIAQDGGTETFLQRLAEVLPDAGVKAREMSRTDALFNDSDWLRNEHQNYKNQIAQSGYQPSMISRIKGEYRAQYGARAEQIFSYGDGRQGRR